MSRAANTPPTLLRLATLTPAATASVQRVLSELAAVDAERSMLRRRAAALFDDARRELIYGRDVAS